MKTSYFEKIMLTKKLVQTLQKTQKMHICVDHCIKKENI
jgi:hypothetical protein